MDGSINRHGLKLALEDTIRRGQVREGFSLDSVINTDLVEEAARELGLR